MEKEFIEQLKRQWMAMIDTIDDPLVLLDRDLKIIRQNKSYWKRGLASQSLEIGQLKNKNCYEVFAARPGPCLHCPFSQNLHLTEFKEWKTADLIPGREFEIRVHPIGENAEERFFVVHYRDVTEQQQLQDSLARADKLAALGKLTGGVAHELNSPLAGILAFSQLALQEMQKTDPHYEDMAQIEEAAQKCKVIVEGMLGFARQDLPRDEAVFDLFDALQSTLRLAAPLLRKNDIELDVNLQQNPKAFVQGTSGKMGQVFLNLITNAVQAMPEGGRIQVRGSVGKDMASVEIQDSGIGIEPSIQHRIFDPFFTTKTVGEGTGLGLSISYSIVKSHKGHISVTSLPGLGSTFTVTLALAHPNSSKPSL